LGFNCEYDNFQAEFYTEKEIILMDRHPQQFKRERQDKNRREKNIADMSKLRSAVKNVLSATNPEDAEKLYKETVSIIDKAASKGLIKKNTAARRKSRITRHLNSLA
jgi:small subunit ribosomal protein S20|tara:strand:+ start:17679 stop:17999 length:321 start_codon:yes stop_codon:yes gene_type:complete